MSIQAQFENAFRTVFNDHGLAVADHMTADDIPGWDSVKHINLVFHIERTFGVRFTTNELAELRCVGDLRMSVEKKLGVGEQA